MHVPDDAYSSSAAHVPRAPHAGADGSWRWAVEVFNPDEPATVCHDLQKEEQ
jgi:hypothetical protein